MKHLRRHFPRKSIIPAHFRPRPDPLDLPRLLVFDKTQVAHPARPIPEAAQAKRRLRKACVNHP
ncbi:MAG: hypothetical protein LW645_11935, partial [Verrucomicrobiaceae bacterium]|nr:hypothetical protein [Verrucomicrobiaceae bacterium]